MRNKSFQKEFEEPATLPVAVEVEKVTLPVAVEVEKVSNQKKPAFLSIDTSSDSDTSSDGKSDKDESISDIDEFKESFKPKVIIKSN